MASHALALLADVMNVVAHEDVFDELQTPIGGVESHRIMQIWDRVEPLFARVVRPETGWSLNSLLTGLQMGLLQLWVIGDFEGVVATQIQERPEHKVLWVQFIAGENMVDWLDDWITVQEAFAREHGCVAVEFSGRKGWHKVSERLGNDYKPILTTFRRDL